MTRRYLQLIGAAAIAGAWAAMFFTTAAAQAPASLAAPYSPPRTADGKPDLQGNWSNVTITNFERTQGQGPLLTQEQVAALEKGATDRVERGSRSSDPNRAAPPVGGDGSTGAAGMVGGYNNVWIDSGDQVIRINGEYRSSIVVDPPDGRVPPTTDAYRAAIAARGAGRGRGGLMGQYDNPEQRPLGERCIVSFGSNAGPPMVPNGFYNNNYTIVQTKTHVMIMTEMVHDYRVIRLVDNRSQVTHLPADIRLWFGDSVGWWEGDTLVVETTNFHPSQVYRGASQNLKVTERFSRIAEKQILYRFTIQDPMFTREWSGELPFNRLDELVFEYACHEGNYAMRNILSGARAQERAAAGTSR